MAQDKSSSGLFSGIFLTHLVLVLHGLVIVGLALLVVFFRGVVTYLPWIVGGGIALAVLSAWYVWRRLVRSERELRDLLKNPIIRDRAVEISFLGGVASLRLGQPGGANLQAPVLEAPTFEPSPQLEDPEAQKLRELSRLVKLREGGHISEEEYSVLKKGLLSAADPSEIEHAGVN